MPLHGFFQGPIAVGAQAILTCALAACSSVSGLTTPHNTDRLRDVEKPDHAQALSLEKLNYEYVKNNEWRILPELWGRKAEEPTFQAPDQPPGWIGLYWCFDDSGCQLALTVRESGRVEYSRDTCSGTIELNFGHITKDSTGRYSIEFEIDPRTFGQQYISGTLIPVRWGGVKYLLTEEQWAHFPAIEDPVHEREQLVLERSSFGYLRDARGAVPEAGDFPVRLDDGRGIRIVTSTPMGLADGK